MSERDWDKEMARIDRHLASMPDEEAVRQPGQPGVTGMPRGVSASTSSRSGQVAVAQSSVKSRIWSYTLLTVAVVMAASVWFWPWAARCGMPLAGLIAAAGVSSLLGVWSSVNSWKQRMARSHILSLIVVLSGALLVAREVLPRIGYAHSTFDRPDRWTCQASPPTLPSSPDASNSGGAQSRRGIAPERGA